MEYLQQPVNIPIDVDKQKNLVVAIFDEPIEWIGMSPENSITFAREIVARAIAFPNKKTRKRSHKVNIMIDDVSKEVVIQFDEPLKWLGLSPEDAIEFAKELVNRAVTVDGRMVSPFTSH
jgi:hypothetical protein